MTAVEFLKMEYIKRGDCLPSGVFQEALEMEKQQQIQFTEDFIQNCTYGDYDLEVRKRVEISEYYNETYGK